MLQLISVNCKLTPVINQTQKCWRPGSPLCGLGALSSLLAGGYLISSSSFCFVLISTASLALAAVLQNPVYTSRGGSINVLSLLSAHSHICPPKLEVSGPHPTAQSCVSDKHSEIVTALSLSVQF